MIRGAGWLLAAVLGVALGGCGYPETRMEEVGGAPKQMATQPAPESAAPAATSTERHKKSG